MALRTPHFVSREELRDSYVPDGVDSKDKATSLYLPVHSSVRLSLDYCRRKGQEYSPLGRWSAKVIAMKASFQGIWSIVILVGRSAALSFPNPDELTHTDYFAVPFSLRGIMPVVA